MKKLFYLFMVALGTMMFTACSDDDKDPLKEEEKEGGEGVITMVTIDGYVHHLAIYSFKEGEIITIDWGDESVEKFKTFLDYDEYDDEDNEISYWTSDIEHKYNNSNPHIITIKGNIKGVNCPSDKLTSLDVSKCTKLTELDCHNNQLTSLDISKNTALIELDCGDNNLTSLEVSGYTALTYLDCWGNNLTSLDVSGCTALTYLECGNNNLTSLDVSGCTALTYLDCYSNNLTSLKVSGCTKLTDLDCHNNNLSAEALNKIFEDLPVVTSGWININSNPGTNTCDKSIAEKKGWK